jgi:16S rRNA (uracil1498-N3)-methyltransferase
VDGRLVVAGVEHRYLTRVRRARVGEDVEVLDGDGRRLRGTVERIEPTSTTLAGLAAVAVREPLSVTLALGLGRPEPLARIVRAATELAVVRLVPLRCTRGLSRDSGAVEALVDRWRRVAAEATRSGGVVRPPEIVPVTPPEAWAGTLAADAGRLVLDVDGEPWPAALRPRDGEPAPRSWALAVGPEGGLTDEELERLVACGFVRASLCPLPLRVETAAVGALAALRALVG